MNDSRFKLKLYVQPGNSREALHALYKALEFHSYNDYEITIIDVEDQPQSAQIENIQKTPTVVSDLGGDKKRVVDDFTDISNLRFLLGFKSSKW